MKYMCLVTVEKLPRGTVLVLTGNVLHVWFGLGCGLYLCREIESLRVRSELMTADLKTGISVWREFSGAWFKEPSLTFDTYGIKT